MTAATSSTTTPMDNNRPGDCPTHGEFTDEYLELPGLNGWSGCPQCRIDRLQASNREREDREHQQRREDARQRRAKADEARYAGAMIPERYKDRTLASYVAENPGQVKALKICRAYVARWDECKQTCRCLTFLGTVGTGKTHLAAAIANEILAGGGTALFRSVTDAIRLVKSSYGVGRAISEDEAYAMLREPDLLVLDEVGAVPLSVHDLGVLHQIVADRYGAKRPIIFTSNAKTTEELEQLVGDRIVDRVLEAKGVLVEFDWASHRRG